MSSEEIFSSLLNHMLEGMMFHENMANYYDFLNLKGFKKCHEYHYLVESWQYREMYSYFIDHFEKLLVLNPKTNIDVIPQNWLSHIKSDVDISTKKNSIRQGLEKWRDWESSTKTLYESLYKELCDKGLVGYSIQVEHCILNVDDELDEINNHWLNNKAIDYDLSVIIPKQRKLIKKYNHKLKEFLC